MRRPPRERSAARLRLQHRYCFHKLLLLCVLISLLLLACLPSSSSSLSSFLLLISLFFVCSFLQKKAPGAKKAKTGEEDIGTKLSKLTVTQLKELLINANIKPPVTAKAKVIPNICFLRFV